MTKNIKRYNGRSAKVYAAWIRMRQRCTNPRNSSYAYYGLRGISVCARWDNFDLFYADMGEPPSPKHSLDRINSDGNYSPDNCRCATQSEQLKNRRPFKRPSTSGERNPKSVLSQKHASAIRRLSSSIKGKYLADIFGVSPQIVSYIIRGETYKAEAGV